jgi:hypothetical protein
MPGKFTSQKLTKGQVGINRLLESFKPASFGWGIHASRATERLTRSGLVFGLNVSQSWTAGPEYLSQD